MTNPQETPPAPTISKSLIDHLRGLYRPDIEVPIHETTMWEYGRRAGILNVLHYLEGRFREQQQEEAHPNVLIKETPNPR